MVSGLFNDALGMSEYAVSNDMIMKESKIRKPVEESG
jgi:hypothetical protein